MHPRTYHIDPIDSAKLKTLILRIQDNVNHCTHFRRYDVVRRAERHPLLQPLLESRVGFLYAVFNLVTGHQLQSLFQMCSELLVGPMQSADERLQRVKLPEQIVRGSAAVALDFPTLLLETFVY